MTSDRCHIQQKPKLDGLAVELRTSILCQVANLASLKSLILTCSAYHQAFVRSRKEVLIALAQHVLTVGSITLQLPLQIVRASSIDLFASDHRQKVVALLDGHPEITNLSRNSFADISIEQILRLFDLHRDISLVCDDLPEWMISKHPITGEEQFDRKELSSSEKERILRSLYRWELWRQLFFPLQDWMNRQGKEAKIPPSDQMSIQLARYPPWEQEELGCAVDYGIRRYDQLCGEAVDHYLSTLPSEYKFTHDDEFCPAEVLGRESFLLSDTRNWKISTLINQGPRFLARILRMADPQKRCDLIMDNVFSFFHDDFKIVLQQVCQYSPGLSVEEEDRKLELEHSREPPFGWQWSRQGLDDYDRSFGVSGQLLWLWPWGYVYWDQDRLEQWGFHIGGNIVYDDTKEGIWDKKTGEEISMRRYPNAGIDSTWVQT